MPTIQLGDGPRVGYYTALHHASMITCWATSERPKCQRRCGEISKSYSWQTRPQGSFNSAKSWTTFNRQICPLTATPSRLRSCVWLPRVDQCQHWRWRNGADRPQRPSTLIRGHTVGNPCEGESSPLLRSPINVTSRRKPHLNKRQHMWPTNALYEFRRGKRARPWKKGSIRQRLKQPNATMWT